MTENLRAALLGHQQTLDRKMAKLGETELLLGRILPTPFIPDHTPRGYPMWSITL